MFELPPPSIPWTTRVLITGTDHVLFFEASQNSMKLTGGRCHHGWLRSNLRFGQPFGQQFPQEIPPWKTRCSLCLTCTNKNSQPQKWSSHKKCGGRNGYIWFLFWILAQEFRWFLLDNYPVQHFSTKKSTQEFTTKFRGAISTKRSPSTMENSRDWKHLVKLKNKQLLKVD